MLDAAVGLNFYPIEFLPVVSWFNGLCSGFNGFFMLNCDPPPATGGHCITNPPMDKIWTPVELWPLGLDSTLNFDPGSWFNIKFRPGIGIKIQFGNVARGHNSTLNLDPGSEFHVELWPGAIIPRWNVIPGHDSTLNCYPDQDST